MVGAYVVWLITFAGSSAWFKHLQSSLPRRCHDPTPKATAAEAISVVPPAEQVGVAVRIEGQEHQQTAEHECHAEDYGFDPFRTR